MKIDGGRVGAEQADQLPADSAERLADVEGGADGGRDRGEGLALGEPLGQLGVQARVVLRQPPPVEDARDDHTEAGEIDGLEDVAGAPALDGLDRRVERRAAGDDDDLGRCLDQRRLAHETRGVCVGKLEIEEDERKRALADQSEPLDAGAGHGDRVPFALEEVAQEEGGVGVMVDDQDGILLAHLLEPITTRW